MFFYIIYNIILSVIIIFIIHNIFNYLKNTLTAPKVKDLIHKPKSAYQKINELISKETNIAHYNIDNNKKMNSFDTEEIKSELKDFFNELNNDKKNTNLNEYISVNNNVYTNNF
tara:strand:+ start:104 stop:445 length:342 start_codon:yes stop_codon:yes gene_type:complete